MNKVHFNPVSNAVFSGRNLLAVQESAKTHGYKSNRWITFFQAKQLEAIDGSSLKGKAVGLVRFGKDAAGKSTMSWYNVFNVEEMPNIPAKLLKGAVPKATKVTKKAAKAAPKKAAKAAKAAPASTSDAIAIPVQGLPGVFLVPDADGTFHQVTIAQ